MNVCSARFEGETGPQTTKAGHPQDALALFSFAGFAFVGPAF